MASASQCRPEDIALVKVGAMFNGWNSGEIFGRPDLEVTITEIGEFRTIKDDEESRLCTAYSVDCELTILKGPFKGQQRMLSSVAPSYTLQLFTRHGEETIIQLLCDTDHWHEYFARIKAGTDPRINEIITLQVKPKAGGKRKDRHGTKKIRRNRRRSSRRN